MFKLRLMIATVVIVSGTIITSVSNHASLTPNGVDVFLNQEPQKDEPPRGFVGFRLGDGPDPGTIAV
jgi:hypothetical protein